MGVGLAVFVLAGLAWANWKRFHPRSLRAAVAGMEYALGIGPSYVHVDPDLRIAYDEISDRIFVTGKQWPELHEIEIVKK